MKTLDFLLFDSKLGPQRAYGRIEGIIDSRIEPFWVKTRNYQTADLRSVDEEFESVIQLGA